MDRCGPSEWYKLALESSHGGRGREAGWTMKVVEGGEGHDHRALLRSSSPPPPTSRMSGIRFVGGGAVRGGGGKALMVHMDVS